MVTSILLVDNHSIFRKGVRMLLEEEVDWRVVGEASDGNEAIDLVNELSPTIVLMDIAMPDMNGVETTRRILLASPDVKIIALSIHRDKQFIDDMLLAGVRGYILKESCPEELVQGVKDVIKGEVFLSAAVVEEVISQYKTSLTQTQSSSEFVVESSVILRTKLYPPVPPVNLIPRPRLYTSLDRGLTRPLTLVSAPAGYGKSVLVTSWLEILDTSSAWLSLDAEDSNLTRFLNYFLAAIQTVFPSAGEETKKLLQAPVIPPLNAIIGGLHTDLDQIEQDFVLVLDDYHLIEDGSMVHELLTEYLSNPPQRIHLVIISRNIPPIYLSKLRAERKILEVRMVGLRFTPDESAAFLGEMLGQSLNETMLAEVYTKNEGWPTGLRLVALSMYKLRGDADSLVANLRGTNLYVQEYFLGEVLSHQTPIIQEYLLKTSILDRFCAPLCDALCSSDAGSKAVDLNGEEFLRFLAKSDLFVTPLDEGNKWYRYHHLFQELLQNWLKRQMNRDEISALHIRASGWLEKGGFTDEAIVHALIADDMIVASRLVIRHGHVLIAEEREATLEHWLDHLPDGIIDQDPMLILFKAWIHAVKYQLPQVATLLDQAEFLLRAEPLNSAKSDLVWGYWNAIRSNERIYFHDIKEARACAQRAVELIPSEYPFMRGFAIIMHGSLLQMAGKFQETVQLLHSTLVDPIFKGRNNQSALLTGLCANSLREADLRSLRLTADRLLRVSRGIDSPVYQAWANLYKACSHYLLNELEDIERLLKSPLEDRYLIYPNMVSDLYVIRSLTYQALGKPSEARETVDLLLKFAMETENPWLLRVGQAFEAELAFMQGRLKDAESWAENFDPGLFVTQYGFYFPSLTQAKIWVSKEAPQSWERGYDLLCRLEEFSRRTHNTIILIPILALQAILLNNQGDESAALERLSEPLAAAEKRGIIRSFVDLGIPLSTLLTRMNRQDLAQPFIQKILEAFHTEDQGSVSEEFKPDNSIPSAVELLIDPLTKREIQTMKLMAKELSTNEIAEELFLSVATVRTHTKRIYSKLNVHSRYQAVQRARELGIIKSSSSN